MWEQFRESLIEPPDLSVYYYLHNVVCVHRCLKAVAYCSENVLTSIINVVGPPGGKIVTYIYTAYRANNATQLASLHLHHNYQA